jgi:hypothetical protein
MAYAFCQAHGMSLVISPQGAVIGWHVLGNSLLAFDPSKLSPPTIVATVPRAGGASADTDDVREERRFFAYQPKGRRESRSAYCPEGENREGKHLMKESFQNRVILASGADEIIGSVAVP